MLSMRPTDGSVLARAAPEHSIHPSAGAWVWLATGITYIHCDMAKTD